MGFRKVTGCEAWFCPKQTDGPMLGFLFESGWVQNERVSLGTQRISQQLVGWERFSPFILFSVNNQHDLFKPKSVHMSISGRKPLTLSFLAQSKSQNWLRCYRTAPSMSPAPVPQASSSSSNTAPHTYHKDFSFACLRMILLPSGISTAHPLTFFIKSIWKSPALKAAGVTSSGIPRLPNQTWFQIPPGCFSKANAPSQERHIFHYCI